MSKIIFHCTFCKKVILDYYSNRKQYKSVFCNKKCKGEWMKLNTGKKSLNWKGGKKEKTIDIPCSLCGKMCTKNIYYYRTAKSNGQTKFYHQQCSIGVNKNNFSSLPTPRKTVFNYGVNRD